MSANIKAHLQQMAKTIAEMIDIVYRGLMDNDIYTLDKALNKEEIVDNLEKEVSTRVAQLSKDASKKEKQNLILLEQIALNIERMGDELRDLIERIEIKITDKLLFSEEGIKQYQEVFTKMHKSVNLIVEFITKNKSDALDEILKNGNQIKKLIEKYRREHVERLTKGICKPRAANIYFDMLDFTGNIARHCTNIARISKEK